MIGLAPHTGKIIDAVAQLECIRPYWLVGGTALSLQLHTRQSEETLYTNLFNQIKLYLLCVRQLSAILFRLA